VGFLGCCLALCHVPSYFQGFIFTMVFLSNSVVTLIDYDQLDAKRGSNLMVLSFRHIFIFCWTNI
jgi:hypothetical protein